MRKAKISVVSDNTRINIFRITASKMSSFVKRSIINLYKNRQKKYNAPRNLSLKNDLLIIILYNKVPITGQSIKNFCILECLSGISPAFLVNQD